MRATCNLHFPETRCSFLPKSKPRLCLRLISPISPICPNPETRSLFSAPETSALYCFYIIYLQPPKPLRKSETWWSFASSSQPQSLCSISGTWQAFSPPRNLSAFSAFFATDGFLRPWKTRLLTFVYIFRYGVGVRSDRKYRAVGGL